MYKRIEWLHDDVKLPNIHKVDFLLKNTKARLLTKAPLVWHEDLVCIIKAALFEEARYVSNQLELDLIGYSNLRKTWLMLPDAKKYID